jgi:RNA polymerase sigma-70 factor (ECF subfamily)
MTQDRPFADVMQRLRAGDQDAATQVFQRFADRLIALARGRLNPVIRAKLDPEDVLQSVFRSFFTRHAEGQFDLANWDSLWSMLVVLTVRKCGRRVGYFHAARRDVLRERAPEPAVQESNMAWEQMAAEPTPAEAAILTETVEQLMRRLDERERQVLALRLQGYTIPEISAQLGRAERTVERVLERVRRWLQQMQDSEA